MPVQLKITQICKQTWMLVERKQKYWETLVYFDEVGSDTYSYNSALTFKQKSKPTDEQLQASADIALAKKQAEVDNPPPPQNADKIARKTEVVLNSLLGSDKLPKEMKDALKDLANDIKTFAKSNKDLGEAATEETTDLIELIRQDQNYELADRLQAALTAVQHIWSA